MLQDLSAGNSAVSNLSKNLILLFFFWITGVQRHFSIWVPSLWQLKADQALNIEHRAYTAGPTCGPSTGRLVASWIG